VHHDYGYTPIHGWPCSASSRPATSASCPLMLPEVCRLLAVPTAGACRGFAIMPPGTGRLHMRMYMYNTQPCTTHTRTLHTIRQGGLCVLQSTPGTPSAPNQHLHPRPLLAQAINNLAFPTLSHHSLRDRRPVVASTATTTTTSSRILPACQDTVWRPDRCCCCCSYTSI
jgi:hypothetical protein